MSVLLRLLWDRLSIYLPVILMGLLALGSWWLVKSTPLPAPVQVQRPARHEPDYELRNFAVRTFDGAGHLKSEVFGGHARHYPDTDTLEIDSVRIRSYNSQGHLIVATAQRALSNGDGSEVQLTGDAVVVRESRGSADNSQQPRTEFRSEFLHLFMNTERIKTYRPVWLLRGTDQLHADTLDYDNLTHIGELRGNVTATLAARAGSTTSRP